MKQWYSADSASASFEPETHSCLNAGRKYVYFIENGIGFAYYNDGTISELTQQSINFMLNHPTAFYPLNGCPFDKEKTDVKIEDSQTWEQSAKQRQNSIFAQIFGD